MKFGLKDTALALALIGALNWGLQEFLGFNVVELLPDGFTKIVYGAVALSAVYVGYNEYMA